MANAMTEFGCRRTKNGGWIIFNQPHHHGMMGDDYAYSTLDEMLTALRVLCSDRTEKEETTFEQMPIKTDLSLINRSIAEGR